jgi:uncharacterized repeat protein (TIGR04042 family)
MHFVARWPDGAARTYYSPSLVVGEYLEPGCAYALTEFVERSRAALRIASERVRSKYGYPCSRAARTLVDIERKADEFRGWTDAIVHVEVYRSAAQSVRDP